MANKTARLGDLATYINGYAFKPADWGDTGLPIIRIQDLTGNSYQLNRYDGEYPERIEVNDGDVLISWSASLGVYLWQRGKALLNQHIFKVVFDKLPVNKEYFVFAVEHKLAEMESKTHGATMKHIVKKDFDGTTIPYPPIEKQAEIADHLRRITSLIDRQTEQLLLLDQLVKSRFIELFGTCVERKRLEEYASLITKGASPKWQGVDYCEEGVLFVTSENVREGYLDLSKRKYLDDKINEIQPRSILKRNDILINIVGASIGRAAVYSCDEIANINQAVALVRVDYSQINQTYLMTYLNSAQAIEMYGKMKKGGARDNLSLQNIADLQIPVASMELQNQFATFVEQTDKSKLCGMMEVAA